MSETSSSPLTEAPKLPLLMDERLLGREHRMYLTWRKFEKVMVGQFGMVAGKPDGEKREKIAEEMRKIEGDFKKCFDAVEKMYRGEAVEGISIKFERNRLPYHDFGHTIRIVEKTLQILPGVLKRRIPAELGIEVEMDELFPIVKGMVLASTFHDIGYLKDPVDPKDNIYGTQAELAFDHVKRAIDKAPFMISQLGVKLTAADRTFIRQMIRATDTNISWKEKEKETGGVSPLTAEARVLGKAMEVADLMAFFTQRDNIPKNIAGLYWENLARVVMGGRVMTYARYKEGDEEVLKNPDLVGRIKTVVTTEKVKPVLVESDDPENDYAIVMEYKFARIDSDDPHPYELQPDTVLDFVASNFMQSKLEEWRAYTECIRIFDELIYDRMTKDLMINLGRITILQDMARERRATDHLSILEGAFNGHDLSLWVRRLQRERILAADINLPNEKNWHEIDKRILGVGEEKQVAGRLATAEIREIIRAMDKGKRIEGITALLQIAREKMRNSGLGDAYIYLAPMAYAGEGGVFEDFNQAIDVFSEAFGRLSKKEGYPDLYFGLTVRRDKDFIKDGVNDEEEMKSMAGAVNQAFNEGKIASVGFLGFESGGLDSYDAFFQILNAETPLVVKVGQTYGAKDAVKDLLTADVSYLRDVLFPKFQKKLILWGLEDLESLDEGGRAGIIKDLPPVQYLLAPTLVRLAKLVTDIKSHPLKEVLADRQEATIVPISGQMALGCSTIIADAMLLDAWGIRPPG